MKKIKGILSIFLQLKIEWNEHLYRPSYNILFIVYTKNQDIGGHTGDLKLTIRSSLPMRYITLMKIDLKMTRKKGKQNRF